MIILNNKTQTENVQEYEIIDAHCHIYPEKIARKAVNAIGDFYGISMVGGDGTSTALLSNGAKAGVKKYIVHSTATTMHQVRAINDFIYKEISEHAEFVGFMTLHPDMSEAQVSEEVELAISRGMKGVKLHPDFQKFNIDEADNIYKVTQGKLPILVHMGDKRYDYSAPTRLKIAAERYPTQIFIAAHFGGYSVWDKVWCLKDLPNVNFDTSSSLAYISATKASELIHEFGYQRFFFGTDYPMWHADDELKRFLALDLTEEERKAILSENIAKLLGV